MPRLVIRKRNCLLQSRALSTMTKNCRPWRFTEEQKSLWLLPIFRKSSKQIIIRKKMCSYLCLTKFVIIFMLCVVLDSHNCMWYPISLYFRQWQNTFDPSIALQFHISVFIKNNITFPPGGRFLAGLVKTLHTYMKRRFDVLITMEQENMCCKTGKIEAVQNTLQVDWG